MYIYIYNIYIHVCVCVCVVCVCVCCFVFGNLYFLSHICFMFTFSIVLKSTNPFLYYYFLLVVLVLLRFFFLSFSALLFLPSLRLLPTSPVPLFGPFTESVFLLLTHVIVPLLRVLTLSAASDACWTDAIQRIVDPWKRTPSDRRPNNMSFWFDG